MRGNSHVRCEVGEKAEITSKSYLSLFANIGLIPNFEKLIATIRSRNISSTIILQADAQLKKIYKEGADIISGNCDTSIFLGGKEKSTIKALSEELGKETINDYNESKTRSNNDSFGQNYSKLGRELMTQDELLTMERDTCIVQIIGKRPFKDKKYDLTKHPRYKFHSDGKKYWFDIDKYLEALKKPKNQQKRNASNKQANQSEEVKLTITTINGRFEI
ncbi:type VI secretion protein [Bacillus pseudomycoides]|uniref:Type VI secretion protein n=1 Tax=Bacillus pseudomycoides TaxID=64104 RepID=A0ABD6TJJ2_9BACI|nr:TraG/TraD/VirD4 family protein [Bacillus pseudomycoides]PHF04252.1 type VI secretion protein [Bacillus pseudomycoides]